MLAGDDVMFRKILYYFTGEAKIVKFQQCLMQNVNLEMIECMKGKSLKGIRKNEEWNALINHYVNYLLPKFTYRQWIKILSIDNFYQKASKNKNIDIQVNLEEFLKCHYIELYQMFDMKVYGEYQKRSKDELKKVVLVNGAINPVNKRVVNAVFMMYKDDSRMCYDVKIKKRIMLENLALSNETLVITLVDVFRRKRFINIIFEEE